MFIRTKFHSLVAYNYKHIFYRFFKMPIYAIIFKSSRTGMIADNWDVARELRDSSKNSFAKKFVTKEEAQKYIISFNYKIVQNTENNGNTLKRKRTENLYNPISSVEDHIKKVKKAFDDFQNSIRTFPGVTMACLNQVQFVSDETFEKLNNILTVNENESKKDISLATPTKVFPGNIATADQNDSSSNLDENSFLLNDKNEVIVYTDGACSNNGLNGASAGAGVWFGINHPLNLSLKVPGTQTNNNAEIYSTIKAIECVKVAGFTRININTDSDFVIKSVNEWMPRWQINGWKTSAGGEVKNKEMFLMLYEQIKSMDSVSWTYVPGHKGIVGNEEADKLARIGAKM